MAFFSETLWCVATLKYLERTLINESEVDDEIIRINSGNASYCSGHNHRHPAHCQEGWESESQLSNNVFVVKNTTHNILQTKRSNRYLYQ